MKKILEVLGITVVGGLGCILYLVSSFIGAVIVIVLVGSLLNLIF